MMRCGAVRCGEARRCVFLVLEIPITLGLLDGDVATEKPKRMSERIRKRKDLEWSQK